MVEALYQEIDHLPAAMESMARLMPEKLVERSCLRPNLSIREAATTVPRTLMVPTTAEANCPLFTPACDAAFGSSPLHNVCRKMLFPSRANTAIIMRPG